MLKTIGTKTYALIETDAGRAVFQETGVPFDQRQILVVSVKAPTTKRRSYIAQVQVVTPILNAEGLVVAKAYDSRERTIPVSMAETDSVALATQAEAVYADTVVADAITKMLPILAGA